MNKFLYKTQKQVLQDNFAVVGVNMVQERKFAVVQVEQMWNNCILRDENDDNQFFEEDGFGGDDKHYGNEDGAFGGYTADNGYVNYNGYDEYNDDRYHSESFSEYSKNHYDQYNEEEPVGRYEDDQNYGDYTEYNASEYRLPYEATSEINNGYGNYDDRHHYKEEPVDRYADDQNYVDSVRDKLQEMRIRRIFEQEYVETSRHRQLLEEKFAQKRLRKEMAGCYIIGENIIHLSPPTKEEPFYVSADYIQSFITACKKLTQKLECLVIVDPETTKPKILQELVKIGREYANFVHIIPAIAAVLQYSVSTFKPFYSNKILIILKFPGKFYACNILKQNELQFYPHHIKTENIAAFQHDFYSDFTDVYCLYSKDRGKQKDRLKLYFPSIKLFKVPSPLMILALGGFYKASCCVKPGKYPEILNFTYGIFNGNIPVLNRCAQLPVQAIYQPIIDIPTTFRDTFTMAKKLTKKGKWKIKWQIKSSDILLPGKPYAKSYLFKYDQFGLLTIQEHSMPLSFSIFNDFLNKNLNIVHVWFIEKQTKAIFNFATNERNFEAFDDQTKNLFTDEWLNNVDQTTTGLSSTASNLHTIFVDKKINNYINGPRISIAPTYIGILQYYITYFKPTTPIVIVILVTKEMSKFYTLIERSPFCYTVTYASKYDPEDPSLFNSLVEIKKKIKILHIYENGMNQFLPIKCLTTKLSITRHEISNFHEVAYYGGAIYALHNSSPTLFSQYVTIDPSFDPEENDCKHLNTVSLKTSTCFYQIDAFFHSAFKSIINRNLFYGNLIAVVLQEESVTFIYFFVHVKNKFLFKFYITVDSTVIIDSTLLHFADIVIARYSPMLTFANGVTVLSAAPEEDVYIEKFLKDMKNENLLIYDTASYSEAIEHAINNGILWDVIYEKSSMIIECDGDKCRIITEGGDYLSIWNDEWIPMYISFSQKQLLFGNSAKIDLEKFPDFVIFDFVQLLGVTSSTLISPKWSFQLIEMDESDDPKLGYKVSTANGCKIISPEMALTIFLQKLILIFEKFIEKTVDEICFKSSNTVLTDVQKEAFKNAAKALKKYCIFC